MARNSNNSGPKMGKYVNELKPSDFVLNILRDEVFYNNENIRKEGSAYLVEAPAS